MLETLIPLLELNAGKCILQIFNAVSLNSRVHDSKDLIIKQVKPSDGSIYRCEVAQETDPVKVEHTLLVLETPEITRKYITNLSHLETASRNTWINSDPSQCRFTNDPMNPNDQRQQHLKRPKTMRVIAELWSNDRKYCVIIVNPMVNMTPMTQSSKQLNISKNYECPKESI